MRKLIWMFLLCLATSGAWADTFYSNPAAWAAAVSGTTNVNFEAVTTPNNVDFVGFGPGAGVTVGGVSFAVGSAGLDNVLFLLGDGVYGFPVATIAAQSTSGTTNELLITLPNSVTALAFNYSGFFTSSSTTVVLSDGASVVLPSYDAPNLQFFGVIAPGGITSVDVTVGGLSLNIDGVTYGSGSAVPEPGSLALAGSAFLAATAALRRKLRL